jgi:hypothetical protein
MNDERDRRIKARAFELWQQSGAIDGQSLVHWLQAEQEIKETEEPPVEIASPSNKRRLRTLNGKSGSQA